MPATGDSHTRCLTSFSTGAAHPFWGVFR
jgi:hypothetical protein